MDGTARYARQGIRALLRNPGFGLLALSLVAVGVGAVTTIFTLVDHVLLRPPPYPEPERLVVVQNGSHSGPDFQDFQETGIGSEWAASFGRDAIVTGLDEPRRMQQILVNRDFFRVLGAHAGMGRLLDGSDYPDRRTVVLGWNAWRNVWGADPDILGRTIRVDGEPLTVVGVLSREFSPPEVLADPDGPNLWRPLDPALEELQTRNHSVLSLVARLSPGVTLETARDALAAVARRRAETWPEHYVRRDGSTRTLPVVSLHEATMYRVRQGLHLLFGAVTLLLLVACANVAHLFLARGLGRVREMAVRRALGADRGALAGQLLVESLVVAVLGGAAGILLARAALAGLSRWGPPDLSATGHLALDLRVVAFAVAVSGLSAIVFGMLPASQAMRGHPGDALRAGGRSATAGRGSRAVRSGLVVAEVALSLVLVTSAGLLVRSFATLTSVDPGVDTEDVWTVPLDPTGLEDGTDWLRTGDAIAEAVAGIPGVRSVAFGMTMPLEFTGGNRCCWTGGTWSPESPDEVLVADFHPVSPDYFTTLGIELLAGGGWTRADRGAEPTPVVLAAETARRLFGTTEGVVGRIVGSEGRTFVVRGVAADVRHYGLDQELRPAFYVPAAIVPFPIPHLHVAARVGPAVGTSVVPALREAVWSVDPDLPVPTVRSLARWSTRSTSSSRFQSILVSAFGAVALLLAAGGLYGTLLYSVGRRRREMGIRMALGAPSGRVQGLVLKDGLVLGAAGAALGLGGALWAARLLESRLFGIGPTDPLALLASAAVLMTTVAVASWAPARRAGRTDPVRTLGAE
jgi:predicted permease